MEFVIDASKTREMSHLRYCCYYLRGTQLLFIEERNIFICHFLILTRYPLFERIMFEQEF